MVKFTCLGLNLIQKKLDFDIPLRIMIQHKNLHLIFLKKLKINIF